MTRFALTALTAFTLLAGCSSTPNTSPSSTASATTAPRSGPQEGVGDALGYSLFGESVYLSKHPGDENLQFASEPAGNYASADPID